MCWYIINDAEAMLEIYSEHKQTLQSLRDALHKDNVASWRGNSVNTWEKKVLPVLS